MNGFKWPLRGDTAVGALLVICAALAVLAANSGWAPYYEALLATPARVQIGDAELAKPLLLWINDGLMAVFFLYVSLEIKRAMIGGALATREAAMLPAVAAFGGMALPALVYLLVTIGAPEARVGWAIPAATDIAFALAALSIAGGRLPASLRTFLLAAAIIDDLGAIVIIAAFYTSGLSVASLALAGLGLVVLAALNLAGVRRLDFYLLIGVAVWLAVLKSGVHATLAGAAVGFAIPHDRQPGVQSPLVRLEHGLKPWSDYFILPVFAFANAGVSFAGAGAALASPVMAAIALGLFLGKQGGVAGAIWLAVRYRIAHLPAGSDWPQMYGVAVLMGIGFTMSLFIGTLAFADPVAQEAVRLGVGIGSLASAIFGTALLLRAGRKAPAAQAEGRTGRC